MCVVCLVCLPSQSEDQQRELVEHYAAVALHFTTGAGDSGGAGLFSSRPDFVATLFGSVHGCVCGVQSTVVVGRRVTVCVCVLLTVCMHEQGGVCRSNCDLAQTGVEVWTRTSSSTAADCPPGSDDRGREGAATHCCCGATELWVAAHHRARPRGRLPACERCACVVCRLFPPNPRRPVAAPLCTHCALAVCANDCRGWTAVVVKIPAAAASPDARRLLSPMRRPPLPTRGECRTTSRAPPLCNIVPVVCMRVC